MPHFKTLAPLTIAVALAVPMPVHAAKPFFSQYLADGRCYQRLYDVRHMRANPQQTLSKFHVIAHEADPLRAQRPGSYTVRFGYWIKNAGYYDGLAVCRSTSAGEACSAEADGGTFALTAASRQIKVTLGQRLAIEGAKGFSPNVATAANQTMLLPKAPRGSCRIR
jgi:hypothetical protein